MLQKKRRENKMYVSARGMMVNIADIEKEIWILVGGSLSLFMSKVTVKAQTGFCPEEHHLSGLYIT